MKPGMKASALAVVLLVGVGTRSASALDSCLNATLTGSYGFVLTGTKVIGGGFSRTVAGFAPNFGLDMGFERGQRFARKVQAQ